MSDVNDARAICNEFRQEISEARSPEMLALAMANVERRINILTGALKRRPDRAVRRYASEELRQLEELVSETRSTNTNPTSLH